MKSKKMPALLRQYPSQMIVVTTDLHESEQLIKDLADEAQQAAPRQFQGKAAGVFFRFQYVAPCETFRELRRLILEVQENTGLRASFKGIVALETSQWIGHEREEYFTVMLKYLYDHRDHWQVVMVLKDCSCTQLQRFLAACAAYMTPRVVDERIFTNEDRLDELIRQSFSSKGYTLRKEARKLLATQLASPACAKARGLTLIGRVADEVIAAADFRKEISETQIHKDLKTGASTLSYLSGNAVFWEKENDEHEPYSL